MATAEQYELEALSHVPSLPTKDDGIHNATVTLLPGTKAKKEEGKLVVHTCASLQ